MATIPGVTQQEMDRYNSLLFAGRRLTDEEKQFRADIAEKIKAAPPVVISQKPVFAEWILNDNIPEGTLDYVGLNIKGQAVEPEPEMKPLTDADENMLDFVASQGASVQALAEIERDLRTSPSKVEETAGGTKMMYQPALLMSANVPWTPDNFPFVTVAWIAKQSGLTASTVRRHITERTPRLVPDVTGLDGIKGYLFSRAVALAWIEAYRAAPKRGRRGDGHTQRKGKKHV